LSFKSIDLKSCGFVYKESGVAFSAIQVDENSSIFPSLTAF